MRNFKFKNVILIILIYTVTSSCVTLQQPLPGSLWGNWAFVQTGTIENGSHEQLVNYFNVCPKESDRIHFSSDNKMTLRWYDRSCTINHYTIGKYHVEGNTLKLDLANSRPNRDSPFPPIKEFRIIQINATTLKLEEIPEESRRQKYQGTSSGPKVLVYLFMRMD